jgi:hypothetical protein
MAGNEDSPSHTVSAQEIQEVRAQIQQLMQGKRFNDHYSSNTGSIHLMMMTTLRMMINMPVAVVVVVAEDLLLVLVVHDVFLLGILLILMPKHFQIIVLNMEVILMVVVVHMMIVVVITLAVLEPVVIMVITVDVIMNDVTTMMVWARLKCPFSDKENADDTLNGKPKWSNYLICMNTLLKRRQSLQPLSLKTMP